MLRRPIGCGSSLMQGGMPRRCCGLSSWRGGGATTWPRVGRTLMVSSATSTLAHRARETSRFEKRRHSSSSWKQKMFSKLSSGTKNAPGYDQAARTVACVAEILRCAGIIPQQMVRLGFFVAAPTTLRRLSCRSTAKTRVDAASVGAGRAPARASSRSRTGSCRR